LTAPLLCNLSLDIKKLVFVPTLNGLLFLRFRVKDAFLVAELDDLTLVARDAAIKRKLVAVEHASQHLPVVGANRWTHVGCTIRKAADDLLGRPALANLFLQVGSVSAKKSGVMTVP
jgi:hypothetical protein